MYAHIVHDNDQIQSRKWVHIIKKTIDELIEELWGVWLIQDIQMENST